VVVGDRGRDVLAAAPVAATALAVAENRRLLRAAELAALRAARHREDAGDRGELDAVELRAAERAARFLPPSDRMRRRFFGCAPPEQVLAELARGGEIVASPDDVARPVDVEVVRTEVAASRCHGCPPSREDTRRRGVCRAGHFVAPALSPGPHLPPRRRREGTLGCPPRLPDPHVRVAPDVERSISNDDETGKGDSRRFYVRRAAERAPRMARGDSRSHIFIELSAQSVVPPP